MATGYEKSQYEIPQSRGMPPVVRYLLFIGLVLIFVLGWAAIQWGGEFHVWPAWDSVKVPIGGKF